MSEPRVREQASREQRASSREPNPDTLRIVSLLPSATEIICALGASERLIGVSHECDFPEPVRRLPRLTRSRIDAHGSSGAIDAAVREVIQGALSLYAVDERLLGALEPDVVVTQDLCEVCAVSLDDVRAAVARLSRRDDVQIVSLQPTRLEHVFGDIERVAHALGRPQAGFEVRRALEGRVHAIAQRAGALPSRPRVVSVEWLDPLMLGGTWMPDLIELAGGVVAGASAGEPAPTVSARELVALAPEVILVKPCGFSLERALGERALIERALAAATALGARVYVTDGSAYFNRPGPRLVESLEITAACVHPVAFSDFRAKHHPVIRELV